MKKSISLLLCLALVLGVALCVFTACNSGPSRLGKYYQYENGVMDPDSWIELKVHREWTDGENNGTYSISEGEIDLMIDGITVMSGTIYDGVMTLTINETGETVVFKKDDTGSIEPGGSDNIEGKYYIVENGHIDPEFWFDISANGTWTDGDGLSGTYIRDGKKIAFHWGILSIEGIIDNGRMYLMELGDGIEYEVVEYVRLDSNPNPNEYYSSSEHVVFLDPDGGEVEKDFIIGSSGVSVKLPTPQREGYDFLGWYDDISGNKYSTEISLWYNYILTAKWSKKVTNYSDEFVFFSPAEEGKKQVDAYYYKYQNIDEYVFVELTCDSVGGKYNIGMPNNFDLKDHHDMEYYVQDKKWQLKWYYGDWSKPNGSQTFTLNYGSNIQLLAVENAQGQIQERYLLDFYVKTDCEVELYQSIESTEPYATQRGYVEYLLEEEELEKYPISGYNVDGWLYYNNLTESYEPFDFTTPLTGDIKLYQSFSAKEIAFDLAGGSMTETSVALKPFEENQVLPIPEKEGYDFIGWMQKEDVYLTSHVGKQLYSVDDTTMPSHVTASYIPKKYYAEIEGEAVRFCDTEVFVIYHGGTISLIGYRLADNTHETVTDNLYCIGDTISSIPSGYALEGWYDGTEKINEEGEHLILADTMTGKPLARRLIPISLEKNISIAGSVSCSDNAVVGGDITLNATTNSDFTFVGWYDGETLLTEDNTYTFVLTKDIKTYTAKWSTEYTIPNGVTQIEPDACKGRWWLTKITIPDSVISIGSGAFSGCSGLTSITIPDSVTSIGNEAFYNCSGLTSITIPDSVTSIGFGVFSGCSGIGRITIPFVGEGKDGTSNTHLGYIFGASSYSDNNQNVPSSVKEVVITGGTSIGDYVFYGCRGLTSITIPNGVTSIGNYAFYGCSGLTSISIPDSVTSIGYYAFSACSGLTSITIPNGVTSIGNSAFSGCSGLTSITIPDGVTSIGEYTFSGCSRLMSITIPDDVTSIGGGAFRNCSGLTSVTIPDSVTRIYDSAFNGCSGLKAVYITDIAKWCGISFSGSYSNPLYYAHNLYLNGELVTDLVIPDSVASIGFHAFEGCSSLTSVTIPFVGASKEGTNNTHFGYIFGASSYSNNSNYVPSSLKEVIITGGASIGFHAFEGCSGLTSITMPDSVTSIGQSAFNGCSGLTSITIPNSVTSIGYYAFNGCSGLKAVYITDIAMWCGISFFDYGENPLYYAHNLYLDGELIKDLVIPDSVTSIGEYTFSGCSGLTSIIIPNSITSIGGGAFRNCSGLTSVTIPDSVTRIHGGAFRNCSGLTSVTISNGVTSIGNYAFSGCSGLTSITIPSSVTFIGEDVFSGCTRLVSITLPFVGGGTDEHHFGYIFGARYSSDNSNYVPSSLKEVIITGGASIDDSAFENCSELTSITIPNSVTSIGNEAFYNCSGLTSITIPDSVTSIGYGAFSGCSGLTEMTIPYVGDSKKTSSDIYRYPFGRIFGGSSYDGGTATAQYYCPSYTEAGTTSTYYIPTALVKVTVTGGNIPYGAFYNCNKLTNITISDSATSIGKNAFLNCSGLTSITIPDSVTSIGESAFSGCSSLTSITLPFVGDGTEKHHFGYIFGALYSSNNSNYVPNSLKEVIITGRASIGYSAFQNCSGLTSVTIPNSVTSIGENAFSGCSGLTSITIPNSVTSIDYSAFEGCAGLTSIVVEKGNSKYHSAGNCLIETKSNELTLGCKTSVIPTDGSVTEIGYKAFSGCSGLTNIIIPNSVTRINPYAFEGCSGLTSITIPSSVKRIGRYAFSGCSGLTSIVFKDTTNWYRTTDSTYYENMTRGTQTSVTNSSTNVTYFTSAYDFNYWYKKSN